LEFRRVLFRSGSDGFLRADINPFRSSLHHCTTPLNDMRFGEIVAMALTSLGANKLRSALTMTGITIGVFSVISVMTAIGALQASIESGISFLGSNIFQFGKYPVNINAGGEIKKKYQNRRDIDRKSVV